MQPKAPEPCINGHLLVSARPAQSRNSPFPRQKKCNSVVKVEGQLPGNEIEKWTANSDSNHGQSFHGTTEDRPGLWQGVRHRLVSKKSAELQDLIHQHQSCHHPRAT